MTTLKTMSFEDALSRYTAMMDKYKAFPTDANALVATECYNALADAHNAEVESARLEERKKLEGYVYHSSWCRRVRSNDFPCTCGLYELMQPTPPKEDTSK